ncbi:MAG TPA: PQQ-binding-like beta-propeller repeat protein [Micromonosporaceae bacterium]|nr:PQQ-binding-like beta-propeller repeat protein [Micromonosporaceae bacterium]
MDRIAVIELGEIPVGQVVDEPPARPWPHRRWALMALAIGLALVTVAGSAPAARPLPMVVLDVSTDSAVLATTDRVFVVDQDRVETGRGRDRYVTAYRLMNLEQLWRVDLPVDGVAVGPLASADTIVVSRLDFATPPDGQPGSGPETAALDAATGAVLWRHEGSAEAWTSAGHLLMSFPAGPAADGESGRYRHILRAVSSHTGDVLWSAEVPAGALWTHRYDGDRVALLALILPGGRIELRDPNTGTLVRAGQIAAPSPGHPAELSAEIVGDLLLVRERAAVAAYPLDRLDLRWRLPLQDGDNSWPTSCDDALCFIDERGGLRNVDPQTGRVRWSDRRWMNVLGTVDGSLLVGEHDPRTDGVRVVALDPDTGQVRHDLGTWDGLDRNGQDEWLIGYQFNLTRALVSRVDPARGAWVLGVLHDVSRSCRVQQPMLLCRRTDNTVGVWRLPG